MAQKFLLVHEPGRGDPTPARRFPYTKVEDAVAQGEHDLARGLPVTGIEDGEGKQVRKVKDGKLVAR